MASGQYLLYDLPTKPPCTTWTPNPWKTRLVFNFKRIDYRTEWVEYPDIKPTLENHVPPSSHLFAYSIPTIVTPDGTYVMDSRKITEYIEQKHPEPSLHLDSIYDSKVEALWSEFMGAVRPVFIPQVPKRLLNPKSQEYWYPSREGMFGMPLDQLEREQGGDIAWSNAEPALRGVTALLKENEGPFFMGKTVSYADLVWASILLFGQRLGEDFLGEILKRSGDSQAHLDLLAAVQPWTKRNDH